MSDDRTLLDAITRAQLQNAHTEEGQLVFEGLLDTLLELTQSEYGFIGEVLREADGTPYLRTRAITNIAWNEHTRRSYDEQASTGMLFRNLKTLFGQVMVTSEPVIANAPGSDPRRGGLPEGHPPLEGFLGLPMLLDGDLVGMCGVANRPGGYDEQLVELLAPFLPTCASLLRMQQTRLEQQRTERELRRSEARSRAILDNAADAIIIISEQGIIEEANASAIRLFSYSLEEMLGHNVSMLMPEPHRSGHDGYLRAFLETGQAKIIGIRREVEGRRKDGSTFPMALGVTHARVDGRGFFNGFIRDISAERASKEELTKLNQEMTARVEDLDRLNHESALIAEMSSLLQACQEDEEAHHVLSLYGERLFPRNSGRFFSLSEDGALDVRSEWGSPAGEATFPSSSCWALRRGARHTTESGDDRLGCQHLRGAALERGVCVPVMTREGPVGLLSIQSDLAEPGAAEDRATVSHLGAGLLESLAGRFGQALANIQLRRRLHEESVRDPLTGLYNRRHLEQVLEWEVRRAQRSSSSLAVVIADVDHFKRFNDEHGHDVGDRALRAVAQVLAESVRGEDCVCRFGGEEFVLVLPTADSAQAAARAETIREALARFALPLSDGTSGAVRLSFGVASFPNDASNPKDLLGRADVALYRAKDAGRNQVVRWDAASDPGESE
jgi:diguanylate cyclase (GGDEF)-like protein/PAS domain S-box-containing protein